MSIVGIVLVLLVVGFVLWVVQTAPLPINSWIRTVIMGVIVLGAMVWLLNALGVHTGVNLHL